MADGWLKPERMEEAEGGGALPPVGSSCSLQPDDDDDDDDTPSVHQFLHSAKLMIDWRSIRNES